jgi:hypothetical protein
MDHKTPHQALSMVMELVAMLMDGDDKMQAAPILDWL